LGEFEARFYRQHGNRTGRGRVAVPLDPGHPYLSKGRELASALPLEFLALLRFRGERGSPLSRGTATRPRPPWSPACVILWAAQRFMPSLPRWWT